jgi:4,5-DOPA dioxygenase extradiol
MSTEEPDHQLMPALFVGHGSPMNAIEDNKFSRIWSELGQTIPLPKSILCISAHWETEGTRVTAMKQPGTIHDFGGFPQALFEIEYPAPGNPELAKHVQNILHKYNVEADNDWGLDHGCWSVLCRMYPDANVPIVQLSLDYKKPAGEHYELAKSLFMLRSTGVLIIGSGNMVHNLGLVAWNKRTNEEYGHDWAIEANDRMKQYIICKDHEALISYEKQGSAFNLAIPSPEHYLPLLYILALQQENDTLSFFNEGMVMGSLSMTSLIIS